MTNNPTISYPAEGIECRHAMPRDHFRRIQPWPVERQYINEDGLLVTVYKPGPGFSDWGRR